MFKKSIYSLSATLLVSFLIIAGPSFAQEPIMEEALESTEEVIKEAILDPAVKTLEDFDVEVVPKSQDITVVNNAGEEIGMVKIREATDGVLMNILVRDLPAGYHGMHFHTVGDCSDLEGFTTSGGHIMPDAKPHGFLHPDGPHAGNLPNLVVGKDGTAEVELYSNLVKYDEGDAALFDEDGSALIIHTNIDDHITQPIGGSGARIACGVIKNKNLETDTLPKKEK